jgi:DNA mismatch repair ATPase MutS
MCISAQNGNSKEMTLKRDENLHCIRTQTLVNVERFITPEMKEYETLVLNAEERIREIELRLFKEVCATPSKSEFKLPGTARALAAAGCAVHFERGGGFERLYPARGP